MPVKLQFPPVFPLSPQKRKRRKHSNLLLLLNPLAITHIHAKPKVVILDSLSPPTLVSPSLVGLLLKDSV